MMPSSLPDNRVAVDTDAAITLRILARRTLRSDVQSGIAALNPEMHACQLPAYGPSGVSIVIAVQSCKSVVFMVALSKVMVGLGRTSNPLYGVAA